MTLPEVLLSVARFGLYPTAGQVTQRPLEGEKWQWLVARMSRGLLTALAVDAADAGALPLTSEQREDLVDRLEAAKADRSAADRCLDSIVTALEPEGIESCVLHGAATAALDYSCPGVRLYDAVHLLVTSGQREQAVSALLECGILRADHTSARGKRRRVPRTYLSSEDVRVVVHTSLTPRDFGAPVEARDIFSSRVTFTPRAVPLRALAPEERLVAACVHARLDDARRDLLAQRDVVQLVLRQKISVRKVQRLASSWRMEAVVAEAVRRAWDTFRVPDVVPLSTWSRSYRPAGRDRRRLAAHPLPSLAT